MGKICKVTLNKETFDANVGDLLLDSAIMSGVDIQHDCRSGVCGSCKVRLVDGKVFGGTEDGSDMIYACQARVVSDIKIVTEKVPEQMSMSTEIAELVRLAPDTFGVTLELPKPLRYLPGQYCNLQFRGFPVRSYSPTYPLEGGPDDRLMHFHIRQYPDGFVSAALGQKIRRGHKVKVMGPLGTAFFRRKQPGRTILVAGGTGFAPMWSIAVAAITERPQREMVVIVATKKLQSFYMHRALCRLARFPNVTIIPVISEPQNVSQAFRSGRPTEYIPSDLRPDDMVYTCGAPGMTDAVAKIARSAGARCYADPFVSHAKTTEQVSLRTRLASWLDPERNAGNAQVLRVA